MYPGYMSAYGQFPYGATPGGPFPGMHGMPGMPGMAGVPPYAPYGMPPPYMGGPGYNGYYPHMMPPLVPPPPPTDRVYASERSGIRPSPGLPPLPSYRGLPGRGSALAGGREAEAIARSRLAAAGFNSVLAGGAAGAGGPGGMTRARGRP